MRLEYYPETDSLYIDLIDRPSVDSLEVAKGVVIDLDENGKIVGIDIDHASKVLDLSHLETVSLPAKQVKVG
jgi:uncharacterized protein YuzE